MSTTTPTHTWTSVLQAVQPPTQEQIELYAINDPPVELIERGARIRSEKVLTDLVRFGGIMAEFWTKATPAQRKRLLGFSEGLLRVTVYSGKRLLDLLEQRGATTESREAARAAAAAAADQSYEEGMGERERLATALENVSDEDAGLRARVDAARGRVVDHKSLATSLAALVSLSREILQDAQSRAARQLVDGGLDAQELDALEALAARIKTSGEQASGARTQGTVSQADLDHQDGVCLAYMDRVMRVFNRAHERDPSIPQLVPITTRRLFSPNRKRPVDAPAAGDAAPGDQGSGAG